MTLRVNVCACPYPLEFRFVSAHFFQSDKDPVPINGLPDVPMDFERLTVMGFGLEQEGAWTGSTYLQEVNVTTVPHGVCNSQYSGDIFQNIMLCAGERVFLVSILRWGRFVERSCQAPPFGPIKYFVPLRPFVRACVYVV